MVRVRIEALYARAEQIFLLPILLGIKSEIAQKCVKKIIRLKSVLQKI